MKKTLFRSGWMAPLHAGGVSRITAVAVIQSGRDDGLLSGTGGLPQEIQSEDRR
jgi:hypothetical protein